MSGGPKQPRRGSQEGQEATKMPFRYFLAAKTLKRAYGALRGREGHRPSIPSLRREGLFNPKSKTRRAINPAKIGAAWQNRLL